MAIRLEYRKTKAGNISPRLVIYLNGERYYENIDLLIHPGDPSKKMKINTCEQIKLKREYEIMMNTYELPIKRDDIKLSEAVDVVATSGIKRVKMYTKMALHAFRVFGDKRISQITKEDCQNLAAHLQSNLSTHSASSYFSAFKRILNDAVENGQISKSPSHGIRMKKPANKVVKDILTIEEFRRLINVVGLDKNKLPMILAYYTGMGLTEILAFGRENVKDGFIQYSRAKNDSIVQIPSKKWILDMLEEVDYSFDHVMQTHNAWNQELRVWCKKAKIKKRITFYCFRHSFAVNVLIASDGDIEILRRYMGHTSYTHTMKYLEYYRAVRGNVIDRLPDL